MDIVIGKRDEGDCILTIGHPGSSALFSFKLPKKKTLHVRKTLYRFLRIMHDNINNNYAKH